MLLSLTPPGSSCRVGRGKGAKAAAPSLPQGNRIWRKYGFPSPLIGVAASNAIALAPHVFTLQIGRDDTTCLASFASALG
jgi:hypothetical protein